ncbi:MAG: TldD/PmbA family protein [Dehalococcoidia bacterium]|nr:TldD/PmbA family protein [Dehalococcoidia bacterium]
MLSTGILRRAAQEALDHLKTQPDVEEVEVFVASNGSLFARISYTSHIPSNGLEEPKSLESYGIGVRATFKRPDGVYTGFGAEPSDISLEGARHALQKARHSAVRDPDFVSLPKPPGGVRRKPARYHDPAVMRITDGELVRAGWMPLEGALEVFESSEELLLAAESPERLRDLGLIFGGDVTMLQEQIAVCSTHFPHVQTDESTVVLVFTTAMVESKDAKGTGFWAGSHLKGLSADAGRQAARNAIASIGGVRVPTGRYRVVLGRQAVMDILNLILLPGLTLDTLYAGASPFQGAFTQQVASPLLNIYDDASLPGLAGSKGITCEGLPTGRVDLIKQGRFVGALSNYYTTQRILHDPKAKEKLGVDPARFLEAIAPRNGFRFLRGGGRQFDSPPGVFGTNIIVEGADPCSHEELLRRVGNGLYIGRIWYTYPINGMAAADFTSTVIGDSFLIENGHPGKPIRANALRIDDNAKRLLNNILAVGDDARASLMWAGDSIVYTPEVAVSDLHVQEIAGYMESVYPTGQPPM